MLSSNQTRTASFFLSIDSLVRLAWLRLRLSARSLVGKAALAQRESIARTLEAPAGAAPANRIRFDLLSGPQRQARQVGSRSA